MPVMPERPLRAAGAHDQADGEEGDPHLINGGIRMRKGDLPEAVHLQVAVAVSAQGPPFTPAGFHHFVSANAARNQCPRVGLDRSTSRDDLTCAALYSRSASQLTPRWHMLRVSVGR